MKLGTPLFLLLASVFGLAVIVRMLITGSAAANGESLLKKEMPLVYWSILALAIALDASLFAMAMNQMPR